MEEHMEWWDSLSKEQKEHIIKKYNINVNVRMYWVTTDEVLMMYNNEHKIKDMEKNYAVIDGKKIVLSEELVNSIKKKQVVTLKNILESRKTGYILDTDYWEAVEIYPSYSITSTIEDNSIVATEQRVKQLQAIILLMNVADYFNNKPEVYANDINDTYILVYEHVYNKIHISRELRLNTVGISFQNKEDVKQAIDILGFNTIKLALTGHGDLSKYE